MVVYCVCITTVRVQLSFSPIVSMTLLSKIYNIKGRQTISKQINVYYLSMDRVIDTLLLLFFFIHYDSPRYPVLALI